MGHVVDKIFIDTDSINTQGLFAVTNGATISNIGVTNANIKADNSEGVGILVGFNRGTIINSYTSGSVSAKGKVGGLVGHGSKIGLNESDISNSYSLAQVSGTDSTTGGLMGGNVGKIRNSYASGRVTGDHRVGGLVGENRGTITASYANGEIIGGNEVGGLIGANAGSAIDSYATASVNGEFFVGGLVGRNFLGTISNSYAAGSVVGTGAEIGGLVGFKDNGAINSSFWDTQATGQAISVGGVGKNTVQMKDAMLYVDAGWSVLQDDSIVSNYPTLRMADSGGVWVIGTKGASTPTPEPTPEPVVPPSPAPQPVPNPTPTPTPTLIEKPDVTAIMNGVAVASPVLPGFPSMVAPQQSFRVPFVRGLPIEIINGGVRLPEGIEQELLIAQ